MRKLGLGLQTVLTAWFWTVQPQGADGWGRQTKVCGGPSLQQMPPSPHPRPSSSHSSGPVQLELPAGLLDGVLGVGEGKVRGFPAASPEHGAASQHVCAVRLPACSGTGCPSLSPPGMSAEGGEEQVKPRSLSAVRPSAMVLGRRRGPEEA